MDSLNPECESAQQALSSAMDDGTPFPAAALDHADRCGACNAFLDAWTGGLGDRLAAAPAPASPSLRSAILELPEIPSRRHTTRPRWQRFISAAAAAVVLGFFAYTLVDVHPAGTAADARHDAREKELAALKSDLRRGLVALRAPSSAVQRVIGQ